MTMVSEQPSRWSKASVYPDMWVDPGEDPRNSGRVSPDGELATLQDYLSDYRLTLRMKCEGLDAEQLARRSVPPSTMSLLGLLRHLAEVERDWRNWITSGDPLPKLYGQRDADFDGAGRGADGGRRRVCRPRPRAGRDRRSAGRASESGRAIREGRYRRQGVVSTPD